MTGAATGRAVLSLDLPEPTFTLMDALTDQMLAEIVATIVRAVDPQRIILFGSRATGTARPDSDLDLLIVGERPFGNGHSRRQELANLWRLLARFRIPKDLLLFTVEEVEHWQASANHIIGRALREGRVLHARS